MCRIICVNDLLQCIHKRLYKICAEQTVYNRRDTRKKLDRRLYYVLHSLRCKLGQEHRCEKSYRNTDHYCAESTEYRRENQRKDTELFFLCVPCVAEQEISDSDFSYGGSTRYYHINCYHQDARYRCDPTHGKYVLHYTLCNVCESRFFTSYSRSLLSDRAYRNCCAACLFQVNHPFRAIHTYTANSGNGLLPEKCLLYRNYRLVFTLRELHPVQVRVPDLLPRE